MGVEYLIDTDILIYYFNGLVKSKELDKVIKNSFNISIITKIEFLSWDILKINKDLEKKAIKFINCARVYSLNNEVANKTIDLRQNNRIKIPDAIIASTALFFNFTLLTNNVKDFKILGLKVISIDNLSHTSK